MLEISSRFNPASVEYFASTEGNIAEICCISAKVGSTCGMHMDCGGRQSIFASLCLDVDLDLWGLPRHIFFEIWNLESPFGNPESSPELDHLGEA